MNLRGAAWAIPRRAVFRERAGQALLGYAAVSPRAATRCFPAGIAPCARAESRTFIAQPGSSAVVRRSSATSRSMACGCPTLTANRYGTLELAQGASVLVEPESIDDIAAGIVRLLEDQPLRATLRRAGLARAKQFTWQRTAAEVMGVLESLPRLSRRRAAPCASDELGEHADSRP